MYDVSSEIADGYVLTNVDLQSRSPFVHHSTCKLSAVLSEALVQLKPYGALCLRYCSSEVRRNAKCPELQ